MAGNFSMRVSAPRLRQDAIRVELLAAVRQLSEKLKIPFAKTVATWDGEKPEFIPDYHVTQGEGVVLNMTLGGGKGADKWGWLNFGTRVRYAILSSDWQSKTTPGFLGSGPGSGRVVKIDINNPQPGIEARDWSVIIMKDFKPVFSEAMHDALADGLRKAQEG